MLGWIRFIIRYRKSVIAATAVVTVLFLLQLKSLRVIIDPDLTLPQSHPYIQTNNQVEAVFGNKFTVIVAVTALHGTIYDAKVLSKVQTLTQNILELPGVVRSNINGLAVRKAKSITGDAEGMTVRPLLETVPQTATELVALKQGVASNPVYENLLVSADGKTTQIVAEFHKQEGGFQAITKAVESVVAPLRDDTVWIDVGGLPIFLSLLESFSQRMAFLFPLALLIIGLIHYEAFRTFQALFLPLLTALMGVAWSIGVLGLVGQPFDVFNASTPILILAIAAGHAVQILKRYYEEYAALTRQQAQLSPVQRNWMAVESSLTKVGPVMVVACSIAALGFFSLMIFEIKTIRTFGIFTGSGILSALVLELTLIPALRSMLKPPSHHELSREQALTVWDRLIAWFYLQVSQKRRRLYLVTGMILVLLSLGGYRLKIDNSQKGYFFRQIPQRLADDRINASMAGTNPIFVYIDGGVEDAIKNPEILRGIERVQQQLQLDPQIGKTVSIVDFIKRMNQAMNSDRKEFYRVPESSELVAQYLLLYSNSGEPGDFDSYVDYGYQRALITAFARTDSSAYIDRLAKSIQAFANQQFPQKFEVRVGGGATGGVALNEVMIREKILNILQIMGAVLLISSLVFRSALAGFLILVPLVAAVFANFGVMGLLGIPLQIATSLVSAMAVGIGADYSIYMSYRLREELRQGASESVAVEKAFKSAGKATLFVSSAVAGGFGVLMFSYGFMIHIWMGFLITIAMLVSSIATLTLFPALILDLRPKFIFAKGALR